MHRPDSNESQCQSQYYERQLPLSCTLHTPFKTPFNYSIRLPLQSIPGQHKENCQKLKYNELVELRWKTVVLACLANQRCCYDNMTAWTQVWRNMSQDQLRRKRKVTQRQENSRSKLPELRSTPLNHRMCSSHIHNSNFCPFKSPIPIQHTQA